MLLKLYITYITIQFFETIREEECQFTESVGLQIIGSNTYCVAEFNLCMFITRCQQVKVIQNAF